MSKQVEKEIRKVLTDKQYEVFKTKAKTLTEVIPGHAVKELTVMYDNPNPKYTFYSKEVDGRLRVRTSKPGVCEILAQNQPKPSVSMLTWKQRIPEYAGQKINKEHEIEVQIPAEEMDSMIQILEEVMHCPRVSSYERNRETFYIQGVEVASDTFPYGHVVELELKEAADEKILEEVAGMLELDACSTSTLSCDDMYKKLCALKHMEPRKDILFDDPDMPKMNEALEKGWLKGGLL